LGVDARYHLVFFDDENSDLGFTGKVSRDGDLFTSHLTITYSF
jgi:hypothetical protein